jgi:squalene-hopene/tetraprenyl-beta-curcumene cyclase
MHPRWLISIAGVLLTMAAPPAVSAQGRDPEKKLTPNSPREPRAAKMSLARSAEFLDAAVVSWTERRKCGSCHTSYPYLMARPALGDPKAPVLLRMRKFFEDRVAGWDKGGKGAGLPEGTEGVTEVVATAATLAFHDAHSTGKLHPRTRQALDRMWTLQEQDGSWTWNRHLLPPLEYDDYYGAAFAAVGVGYAPGGYAQTEQARAGLAKLRKYFRANKAPDPHHRAMLLWASLKVEGLLTDADRKATVKELLGLQQPDGGWSLPSLGNWKRHDGKPNDPTVSDGYGTGFVVYVLRQAGVPADHARLKRGVAWLKANQRQSGRWFTRSVSNDRAHYITNAGTAFAVLALRACEPAGGK